MFSILLHPSTDEEEFLIADLAEVGVSGIVQEDLGIRAFFDNPAELDALLARFTRFAPEPRDEQNIDWEQATRDAWPPVHVGQRFYLAPPWCTDPTPDGKLRLVIEPGMASGTGRHPATRLCLEAIDRFVKPGDRVLDVGTGSGILSVAADLVGAGQVISCDIHEDSIAVARQCVSSPVFVGSIDAVKSNWADVIVANIDSAVIEQLADEFARVRTKDARLIVSGFPEWDLPENFAAQEKLSREEWVCLIG